MDTLIVVFGIAALAWLGSNLLYAAWSALIDW
jgi:hypothetical protein